MSECLTDEQLEAIESGACAGPDEAEEWKSHLEACGTCRSRLEKHRERQAYLGRVKPVWVCDGAVNDHIQIRTSSLEEEPKSPTGGAAAMPALTDSIQGYQITREIHRGGQGVVYQAIQKTTRRKVAIKVMREGPFAGPKDKARFEREVQILAALNHANIVAVHDSGVAGGNFYFVMDYISGQPLDVYMAGSQRSLDQTLQLFARICEAVNAAHLRGVIHRDLKPGNIRIDADGEPHVLDFGLAKMATGQVTDDSCPQVMTVTGQFLGSLPWASPEQAEGIPAKIDMRTDVYSLGVILYQMLTGKFPYDVVGNMRDVLDRIMNVEPARPSTIAPARSLPAAASGRQTASARGRIDDEVDTIVLKCLAKERDRRYQTAGELARDVRHYLASEPIEAKRDSAAYVLRKTLRRYWAAACVMAGFVGLLGVSSLVAWVLYISANNSRKQAQSAEHKAEDALALAEREALNSRHAAAHSEARYLLQQSFLLAAFARATDAYQMGGRWEDGLLFHEIVTNARRDWSLVGEIALDAPAVRGRLVHAGQMDLLVVALPRTLRTFNAATLESLASVSLDDSCELLITSLPSAEAVTVCSGRRVRLLKLPGLEEVAKKDYESRVRVGFSNLSETVLIHEDGTIRVVDVKDLADHAFVSWRTLTGGREPEIPYHGCISPSGRRILFHAGPWWHDSFVWDRTASSNTASTASMRSGALDFMDETRVVSWHAPTGIGGSMDSLNLYDLEKPEKDLGHGTLDSNETKGRLEAQAWVSAGEFTSYGLLGKLGCAWGLLAPTFDIHFQRYENLAPVQHGQSLPLCANFQNGLLALTHATTVQVFRHVPLKDLNRNMTDFCMATCERGILRIDLQTRAQFVPYGEDQNSRVFQLQSLKGNWFPWAVASAADASVVALVVQESEGLNRVGDKYGRAHLLLYRPGPLDQAPDNWPVFRDIPLDLPAPSSAWDKRTLAVTPDGAVVFYCNEQGRIVRYSVPSGQPLGAGYLGKRSQRSADGRLVGALDENSGTLTVLDVASGKEAMRLPKLDGATGWCFAADAGRVLVSRQGQIETYRIPAGERLGALASPLVPLAWPATGGRFVAFQPDVGAEHGGAEGGNVVLADAASGLPTAILNRGASARNEAFYSPSGKELALVMHRWRVEVIRSLSPERARLALARTAAQPRKSPPLAPIAAASAPAIPEAPAAGPGAIAATDLTALRTRIDQQVTVEGQVIEVKPTVAGNALNIEFAGPEASKMMAWVSPRSLPVMNERFGGDLKTAIHGKNVRLTGTLERYGGRKREWQTRLQITLDDPAQLHILPESRN